MIHERGNPVGEKFEAVHFMTDGKNPVCFNGGWHIKYTEVKKEVTCKICKEKLTK